MKETVNFRIDTETIEKFKKICDRFGVSYQAKIRELMRKYVEQIDLEKDLNSTSKKINDFKSDFDIDLDI